MMMTPTHSFFCERRDAYDDDIAHSSHSSSSSTHYAHTRWFEYKTWRVEARTSKSDAMSSCVAARNLSSRPSSASSRNRSVSRPSSRRPVVVVGVVFVDGMRMRVTKTKRQTSLR
jgi:hypothetical protein